ncbi:MAG: hypothetical protein AAF492_23155, partial [Verrucomicrobiota bacterium]
PNSGRRSSGKLETELELTHPVYARQTIKTEELQGFHIDRFAPWGDPVDGIRARLRCSNRNPGPNEDLILILELENISDKTRLVPWIPFHHRVVESGELHRQRRLSEKNFVTVRRHNERSLDRLEELERALEQAELYPLLPHGILRADITVPLEGELRRKEQQMIQHIHEQWIRAKRRPARLHSRLDAVGPLDVDRGNRLTFRVYLGNIERAEKEEGVWTQTLISPPLDVVIR